MGKREFGIEKGLNDGKKESLGIEKGLNDGEKRV